MSSSPREHRLCPLCDRSVTRVHRTLFDKALLRPSVYWCKDCQRRVVPDSTAAKQRQRWRKREGVLLTAVALAGLMSWFLWIVSRPPQIRKSPKRVRTAVAKKK